MQVTGQTQQHLPRPVMTRQAPCCTRLLLNMALALRVEQVLLTVLLVSVRCLLVAALHGLGLGLELELLSKYCVGIFKM